MLLPGSSQRLWLYLIWLTSAEIYPERVWIAGVPINLMCSGRLQIIPLVIAIVLAAAYTLIRRSGYMKLLC